METLEAKKELSTHKEAESLTVKDITKAIVSVAIGIFSAIFAGYSAVALGAFLYGIIK